MCGRFVTPDERAMESLFGLTARQFAAFMEKGFRKNFDTSPTQQVPVLRVVRDIAGERELVPLRWGLIPSSGKGKWKGAPLFNATIEKLRTWFAWKLPFTGGRRCLVPVSGFYEWQAQPPDWQTTVRHYITLNDQDTFCFAGLWESSESPEGTVESVTVITMPANSIMATIHNSKKDGNKRVLLPRELRRMPAILRREDWDVWLTGTPEQAWEVLKQYPSELMVAWPSPSRGPNDASLIQPIDVPTADPSADPYLST